MVFSFIPEKKENPMRVEKHSFPPMFTCIDTPTLLLEFKNRIFAITRFRMNAQGGLKCSHDVWKGKRMIFIDIVKH